MLAIGGWAISRVEPVLKILWEDYVRAHPVVQQRLKNMSQNDTDPVYAGKHKPLEDSVVEPH
jgi:hypothetical protein